MLEYYFYSILFKLQDGDDMEMEKLVTRTASLVAVIKCSIVQVLGDAEQYVRWAIVSIYAKK